MKDQIKELLDDGEITDDQLGKHCNECKNSNWSCGGPDNLPLTWECTKGIPFNPETDVNEDHGWLKLDGEEVHPEIYAEAIKQCSGFELDYEEIFRNRMIWDMMVNKI